MKTILYARYSSETQTEKSRDEQTSYKQRQIEIHKFKRSANLSLKQRLLRGL